jgi:hypothetical protein
MLLRAIYPLYDVADRRRWRIDQSGDCLRSVINSRLRAELDQTQNNSG